MLNSRPALPLTGSNLALVEREVSYVNVLNYVAKQGPATYSPKAPSLSPMLRNSGYTPKDSERKVIRVSDVEPISPLLAHKRSEKSAELITAAGSVPLRLSKRKAKEHNRITPRAAKVEKARGKRPNLHKAACGKVQAGGTEKKQKRAPSRAESASFLSGTLRTLELPRIAKAKPSRLTRDPVTGTGLFRRGAVSTTMAVHLNYEQSRSCAFSEQRFLDEDQQLLDAHREVLPSGDGEVPSTETSSREAAMSPRLFDHPLDDSIHDEVAPTGVSALEDVSHLPDKDSEPVFAAATPTPLENVLDPAQLRRRSQPSSDCESRSSFQSQCFEADDFVSPLVCARTQYDRSPAMSDCSIDAIEAVNRGDRRAAEGISQIIDRPDHTDAQDFEIAKRRTSQRRADCGSWTGSAWAPYGTHDVVTHDMPCLTDSSSSNEKENFQASNHQDADLSQPSQAGDWVRLLSHHVWRSSGGIVLDIDERGMPATVEVKGAQQDLGAAEKHIAELANPMLFGQSVTALLDHEASMESADLALLRLPNNLEHVDDQAMPSSIETAPDPMKVTMSPSFKSRPLWQALRPFSAAPRRAANPSDRALNGAHSGSPMFREIFEPRLQASTADLFGACTQYGGRTGGTPSLDGQQAHSFHEGPPVILNTFTETFGDHQIPLASSASVEMNEHARDTARCNIGDELQLALERTTDRVLRSRPVWQATPQAEVVRRTKKLHEHYRRKRIGKTKCAVPVRTTQALPSSADSSICLETEGSCSVNESAKPAGKRWHTLFWAPQVSGQAIR